MHVTADSLCPGDLRQYLSHLEIVFGVDISGLQVLHDVHDGTRADAMPPRAQALPRENIHARILFVDGRQVLRAEQRVGVMVHL